jgi:hypothetical protein
MAKQDKTQPDRTRVKVLRFPDASVSHLSKQSGADMLADSIRKAWLQKKPRTA